MYDLLLIVFGAVAALALDRAYRWLTAQRRGENAERKLRGQLALYRQLDPKTKSQSLLSDPAYHTETRELLEKHFNAAAGQLFAQVTQQVEPNVSDVIEFLEKILQDWDKYRKGD